MSSRDNQEIIFHKRDKCFAGSNKILRALSGRTNTTTVVLHGVSGVGKSTIAIEYMYRKLEDKSIKKAYWFNAEFDYKINDLLYLYGTKLEGHNASDDRLETIEKFVQSIEGSKDVLLVFDNVEDLAVLKKVINIYKVKCKILITSRNPAVIPSSTEKINLYPYDDDETKEYIERRLIHLQLQDRHVNAISRKLMSDNQSLPYNLNFITADILNKGQSFSVKRFLESGCDLNIQRILDNLEKQSREAVVLLKNIAFVDPDWIPDKLVERILKDKKHKEAIEVLCSQNLCKIVFSNSPYCGISIHRLLQNSIEASIVTQAEKNQIISNLINILYDEFPAVSSVRKEEWIKADMYYRHLKKLEKMIDNECSSNLFYKLSLYNKYILGHYSDALEYAKKAFNIADENNCNDEVITTLLQEIGTLYSYLDNYNEALDNYTNSLKISKRIFKEEDKCEIATCYYNIGVSHYFLNNHQEALKHFMLALDMFKRIFKGEDHGHTASCCNSIAETYLKQGNKEKALEYNVLTLEMAKRLFNEYDPFLVKAHKNIGNTYYAMGNNQKALEYYGLLLKIYEKVLKNDHPEKASCYNKIGVTSYGLGGHNEQALRYHVLALEMYKRLYRVDHARIAGTYNNIGIILSAMENNDQALQYKILALEMYKRVYKGDHPIVASCYNKLGITYSKLRQFEKALESYTASLDMRSRLHKGDHCDIASCCHNIADVYFEFSVYEIALKYFMLSLEMYKRIYKGDHSHVAMSYENVGNSYYGLKDTKKALEYYTLALDMRKRLLPIDHPDIKETESIVAMLKSERKV